MAEFVIPVDFRINTMGGQLDIPAGATVHTHPDGAYAGWTPASVSSAEAAPVAADSTADAQNDPTDSESAPPTDPGDPATGDSPSTGSAGDPVPQEPSAAPIPQEAVAQEESSGETDSQQTG